MTSAPGCGRPGRVPLPEGFGWDRGTDPNYLADLVTDWADRYDWRLHEERLLAQLWVTTGRGETSLRAVHQPSSPDAPAVILLHGWPDCFSASIGRCRCWTG